MRNLDYRHALFEKLENQSPPVRCCRHNALSKMRNVLTLGLLFLFPVTALAQTAPKLGYIFPPAIPVGSQIDVKLGGFDFTPDTQFIVLSDKVTLNVDGPLGDFLIPEPPYWFGAKSRSGAFPIPREFSAQIHVPSDVDPGVVHWQVANANGSASTAVLYVTDQTELVEERFRDEPQQLPSLDDLPVAVSGRIQKIAEVDRYRFTTPKDGPITVELFARRLGSNFNGIVEIRDLSGRLLADVADTMGLDCVLTFDATADESYVVSVFDIDFRGNRSFVYRLALNPAPRVITTIPAAGRRGETREILFIGYGVATGAANIESVTHQVTFPSSPEHRVLRYRLETPFGIASAVNIALSDIPEMTEQTQQDSGASPLTVPGAVTGMLDGVTETDAYTWEAKKDEVWQIRLQSRAIGSDLDTSLSIRDVDGKQVAENDDLAGSPDAGLDFTVPADGTYTCLVSDLSGNAGGLAAVYRLALERPPSPDFVLGVPQQISVANGGSAEITVTAARHGGFNGEIQIQVEGLPDGLSVPENLKIAADQKELKFSFQMAEDAASHTSLIKITGSSILDENNITRTAMAAATGNLCTRKPSENLTPWILLTTTMKPPFSLNLVDKTRQRSVHRGTTYPAEFIIKRDEGFQGKIMLQMAANQTRHRQGIRGPVITVPPEVEHVLYPSFLPEWLETDRTTRMVVQGVALVADAHGNIRYLTQPANAPITMILEGALLKLAHTALELTVHPGDSFEVPIELLRSAKLIEPTIVELEVPAQLSGILTCTPITISTEQDKGLLRIETINDPRLLGTWQLKIKATALQDGVWPAISQTQVPVVFQE